MCIGCKDNPVREKHWVIVSLRERPGDFYRFSVSGWNYHRGEPFHWHVPSVDGAEYERSAVDWRTARDAFMEAAGRSGLSLEHAIRQADETLPLPPVVAEAQRLMGVA